MRKRRKSKFFFTRRAKPSTAERDHYQQYKELARADITKRVEYWNRHYNFIYNRIAIKNHQRRWGSCSSLRNLNFNYKLILLPTHLSDYIVVHELCHLKELHHGKSFWLTVAETLPEYQSAITELRWIEKQYGTSTTALMQAQAHYQSDAIMPNSLLTDTATS